MKEIQDIIEQFRKIRIVPVIQIEEAKDAASLAEALEKGGLPCAEVTFRTKAAAEAIRVIRKTHPDMLVGAGTVLTTDQVDAAMAAGAQFLVSPGLNPSIVRYSRKKGMPMLPGVATASEIEQALELGICTVKFFPAEVNGGIRAIRAFSAPYPQVTFMPTGGINLQNVREYLAFDRVVACGGSWIASQEQIRAGRFEEICRRAAEAAEAAATVFELREKVVR